MCGAPVFVPAIPARFVRDPALAADVTPWGSSSSETSAPPHDKSVAESYTALLSSLHDQQVMAEAARGLLLAAAQRMAVPVPPPIKTRLVPKPTPMPDAGASAPSTPCSSSLGSTPSPRGPLPSRSSDSATSVASGLAMMIMPPMMPLPTSPAPAPCVEVRQVWACNFDEEARLIESLLPQFPYAAVDTEFPGTVYRPAGPAYTLNPAERYSLLKSNVDALELIQLGLTLHDPGTATSRVWQFNLREFDVRRHRHAPESVALLRANGVDFRRTRLHGVDAAALGPRLRRWVRAAGGLGRAGVVTFSGGYDLAYLVKTVFGAGFRMPPSAEEFEAVAAALLRRRRVFDVKEMARLCPADLRGGLNAVAAKLGVVRAVGEAHQAGSDSLLTCHTFMKLREKYFDDDAKLTSVAGIVADITSF